MFSYWPQTAVLRVLRKPPLTTAVSAGRRNALHECAFDLNRIITLLAKAHDGHGKQDR